MWIGIHYYYYYCNHVHRIVSDVYSSVFLLTLFCIRGTPVFSIAGSVGIKRGVTVDYCSLATRTSI